MPARFLIFLLSCQLTCWSSPTLTTHSKLRTHDYSAFWSPGAALECFRQNVAAQGGDARVCDDPAGFLPLVSESIKVESPRSGFITEIETTEIGHAIAALGGGRVRIEDKIDPTVGFTAEKKIGDKINSGELLGTVYARDQIKGTRDCCQDPGGISHQRSI